MLCYLVRHGQDDETVRGGWSNHGLTPLGVEQVHALGKELLAAGIQPGCIYSSDLPRARETAEILAGYLHLGAVLLPEFREANNGDLAGMKHDLANEKYPGVYWSALDWDACYPNGESPEMFFHRIRSAWQKLKMELLKCPSEEAMLVTHGGVIEVILCLENGVAFSNKIKHFSAPNAKPIPVDITYRKTTVFAPSVF